MENFYCKKITTKELEFYKVASQHGISPPIIKIQEVDDQYLLYTNLYRNSMKYFELKPYKQQMLTLIQELHNLGIYHGDIHEDNFVLDPVEDKLYLIDFGLSKWIHNITEKELLEENMYSEEPACNIPNLLRLEVEEINFLTEYP